MRDLFKRCWSSIALAKLLVIGFGLPDSLEISNGDLIADRCDATTQTASSELRFIHDRIPELTLLCHYRGNIRIYKRYNFDTEHGRASSTLINSQIRGRILSVV